MGGQPKPQNQSIEELFRSKQTAASASPATTAHPQKKPQVTPKKLPHQLSKQELLDEKMHTIEVQQMERLTVERSQDLGLPYINLEGFAISPEALVLVPRDEARRTKTVAFLRANDDIRLGTIEPSTAVNAIQERLKKDLGLNVEIYLISENSFRLAERLYDMLPEVKEIIYGYRIEEETLKKYADQISNLKSLADVMKRSSMSDVITLVLGGAIKTDASDVHVEAEEEDVKVRYRIDGDLHDAVVLPRDAWKQMITRLKLLAGVKINIEDVPQDGRITIYLTNEKIDIRVSFLPTAFGESVVMRLLRPKSIALEFEQLGVRGRALAQLKKEIGRPNGMIVTTGPTGSGKTTTLYAVLKHLNTEDVKIITLEEPIEYKLKGINQSQVDYSKEYTFTKGLRSILRQDPDIVMVGEIRDLDTAEIAIQAALTGHLVISTIHTNSAAGAIPRFLSMGVKPFLLAPSINCVIGQRLVKRINPDEKIPVELSPSLRLQVISELKKLHPDVLKEYKVDLDHLQFYGPKPDAETPYKGRVGIYEIFSMNKEIETLILSGKVSEYDMIDIALKSGMITMAQDGLLKALDGLTTVEEVLRAAELQEIEDIPAPETKEKI